MEIENLYKKLSDEKFIISGPCVIESKDIVFKIADELSKLSLKHNVKYIFKASFDKANRTSLDSYRGPGLEKGLRILDDVKKEFDLHLTTDIHEPNQALLASEVVDILQIPAFLCRQTDLLVAAAKTKKIVNIKKAQFLNGIDMIYAINKVKESGNENIMLTERGTMFGLGNLVVDFRQIIDMKKFNLPVILDVTHSTQKPGSLGGKSGGDRLYAPYLTKIGKALDVNGYFFETHPNPEQALSDGPNMIYLKDMDSIFEIITK